MHKKNMLGREKRKSLTDGEPSLEKGTRPQQSGGRKESVGHIARRTGVFTEGKGEGNGTNTTVQSVGGLPSALS